MVFNDFLKITDALIFFIRSVYQYKTSDKDYYYSCVWSCF